MAKDAASLTRRERQIMDILHRRGHATVQEVLDELPDPPSYSSIRALMRILEERGHIHHLPDGTRYVYAPTVKQTDARKSAIAHVVHTFFGDSIEEALAALVESPKKKLSKDELDRLSAIIDRAKKEGR